MSLLLSILVLYLSIVLSSANNFTGNIKRVSDCINVGGKHAAFRFPIDAEDHYQFLLKKTEKFRNIPAQVAGNPLNESYIEKLFIDRFLNKPISFFGGMVPIMVQWSDYQLSHRHLSTAEDEYAMFHEILKYLRSDVLYVAVSQANKGIKMFSKLSNVLILSAGGVGHIPIPLAKGQLNHTDLNVKFSNCSDLGFFGTVSHGPRKTLIKQLQQVIKDESKAMKMTDRHVSGLVIKSGPGWVTDMQHTLFNLAPVGFGRGSFRLSEVIRLGRIPVYLYQDYPWLPYEGTDVSPEALGLLSKGGQGDLSHLYGELNYLLMHPELIEKYLEKVKKAYWYYTNAGVLQQIELFFSHPFSAGYLRCSMHYRRYRQVRDKSVLGRLGLLTN